VLFKYYQQVESSHIYTVTGFEGVENMAESEGNAGGVYPRLSGSIGFEGVSSVG